MNKLNELRALNIQLLIVAKAVQEYLNKNVIEENKRDELNNLVLELLDTIDDINDVAIDLAIEEMQKSADDLNRVINKAKETIKTLTNIGHAINIAAAIADIAAGVAAKDPGAVGKGLTSIMVTVSAMRNE